MKIRNFYFSVLLLAWALPVLGQKVSLVDGKVKVMDTAYCYYQETYSPNAALKDEREDYLWQGARFSDFIFGTTAGDHLFRFTAKKLAIPGNAYVVFYYNILFPDGRQLNMVAQPYTIENFSKELVKYDVFYQGQYNDEGAAILYDEWAKNNAVIKPEVLARGAVSNYNVRPGQLGKEIVLDKNNIIVKGKKIGTYEVTGSTATKKYVSVRYHTCYIIRNNRNDNVATIFVTSGLRSSSELVVEGQKEEHHTLTVADQTEEGLVTAGTYYLLYRHLLP